MRQLPALIVAIALAATACSNDTDTATEVESPTTTEASAAPVTEPVALVAETEPASGETGDDIINIETEVDFESEPPGGTFVVDQGADQLGCRSGSVVEKAGQPRITNTFTCEDGDREGTFTFMWMVVEGSEGPGDFNGPWSVLDATGDFAGLTGEGLWSGVVEEETGFGSFPGAVEFGPVRVTTGADPVLIADLTTYVEAFGTGDADLAWSMVSARCLGIVPETEYRNAVAAIAGEEPGLTASNISAIVYGDTAAVSYDTSADWAPYVAQPWSFTDGKWHWDSC